MVAFFFLFGCVSIEWLSGGIWLCALAALGAALIPLSRKAGMRAGIGIAILCFALGSLHAHAAFDVFRPDPGRYQISGSVYGESILKADGSMRFVLGDITLNGEAVPGKAYCSLRCDEEPPVLFDGAQLSMNGYVYHPGGKSGETHMDFRLWMRQRGYAFGISIYEAPVFANTAAHAPVKDAAYRVRQVFSAAFERTMGENGRMAMALLFGQRSGLTDEEYAAFQDLGIAHIMSVSGLHIGLVSGLLLLILDRFSLRRHTKLLFLGFFLLDYCALTGFSAAAVRAAVMLIFASMSRLFVRRGDPVTTLSAAMLAVLIIDPLSALSAGFVLSFSAMLGIILYARPVQAFLDKCWPQPDVNIVLGTPAAHLAKAQQYVKSLFTISLTAQLGVLLPTMRYFHQLPLYGILINLLIVPFTGVILVPLYVLTLICSLFPFIGSAVGGAASLATDGLLWLVRLLSRLPCAAIRTGSPPAVLCVGFGAALIWLSRRVPGRLPRRALAALLTAAIALGAACLHTPANLRYIQLDVGQADAAVLLDGDQTIVIDTGTDGSEVLDLLRYENRAVDALILTHLHADHAGGAEAILQSGNPVRHIYLPVLAQNQKLDEKLLALYERLLKSGIPVSALASGDELRYNRSTIRVLWPQAETVRSGSDANDYSLALAIELDGFTLLSMADISAHYERYAARPADVLKVAHHGSAGSTGDAFLDFVSPQYALLTVSGGGALPSPQTLNRLSERGISVFRTDECGDLTISVQGGELTIMPYKERTVP